MKLIGRGFVANDEVLEEFKAYLDSRKLHYTPEELEQNHTAIVREIEEEVLRQVFGEGAARKRSLAWDPQVQRALALVPRAAQLLNDPKGYVAERERERQLADAEPKKDGAHQ